MMTSAGMLEALSGPHVRRAWFAYIELPTGARRFHTGLNPVNIGGFEWEPVNDPFGGQLVGLNSIMKPKFGTASYIDIIISGANRDYLKAVWDMRHEIEGVKAEFSFATFDGETNDVIIPLTKMATMQLTSPSQVREGTTIRALRMRAVSVFESLQFAEPFSQWSPAGQRARYPGDKGLDTTGSEIVTNFKQ